MSEAPSPQPSPRPLSDALRQLRPLSHALSFGLPNTSRLPPSRCTYGSNQCCPCAHNPEAATLFKAWRTTPNSPHSGSSYIIGARDLFSDSDNKDDENDRQSSLSTRLAGPIDPSKCLAASAGINGGTREGSSTSTVVVKDYDGWKISAGGANVKVKVSPRVGVSGTDQEGIVEDQNDGTYTATYAVPERGNCMVQVECNGRPIMGSPFPVIISAGVAMGTTSLNPMVSPYPNMVNQTMPNMSNYSGSISGAFSGLLGMILGMLPGASGGCCASWDGWNHIGLDL